MKTLLVNEITPPSLQFQETNDLSGPIFWTAVYFSTDIEKSQVVGNYDHIRLQVVDTPIQILEFSKATIMLNPNQEKSYILTYNKCQNKLAH